MGFRRSLEDSFGNAHSEAYYRVLHAQINNVDKKAFVKILIYKNKDARDAEKYPFEEWIYNVTDATEFDTYFLDSVLKANNSSPVQQAYLLAKAKIDDPLIVDIDPD